MGPTGDEAPAADMATGDDGGEDSDAAPGVCANIRASALVARAAGVYDRSGLLTVRCRHAVLLRMVDVPTGERFAYSFAAIAALCARGLPVKYVWYDVGDGRFAAAMRHYTEFAGIKPVLPAMHAHMHGTACRVRAGEPAACNGASARGLAEGAPRRQLSMLRTRRRACAGATLTNVLPIAGPSHHDHDCRPSERHRRAARRALELAQGSEPCGRSAGGRHRY